VLSWTFEEKAFMAGERYIPSLLTRLTDDEPQSRIDKQDKVFSLEKIKQEIIFNISQLLNSRSHMQYDELRNDIDLVHSVLGFGLTDFCGLSNCQREKNRLIVIITDQLRFFEPRLKPETIEVKSADSNDDVNILTFSISAEYALKACDESFECTTKLDLESGFANVVVKE